MTALVSSAAANSIRVGNALIAAQTTCLPFAGLFLEGRSPIMPVKSEEGERAGQKIIEGATEALAVARGEQQAASIWHNGFRYVPAPSTTCYECDGPLDGPRCPACTPTPDLEKRVAELEETLRFYADPLVYEVEFPTRTDGTFGMECKVDADRGERARSALQLKPRDEYRMFLDDERFPATAGWSVARSSDQAIRMVEVRGVPAEISFDHDLGGEDTSMIFITWLQNHLMDKGSARAFDFSVHSQNPVGRDNIIASWEAFDRAFPRDEAKGEG
jgi:hypothetical protein